MHLLTDPPRFLLFTGKGGVGKTSLACATAVTLADAGRRVLLVSTDPASNIAQVLGQTIGDTVTTITDVAGLSAVEIDPEAAAAAYRERIVGPVRGLLPDAEIAAITEQLSGSCTTEVAAFDEFTELLSSDELAEAYDHIVLDTAPTGHTIRLLQLPGSWTEFLQAGKGDASCLGPLSGLEKQRTAYARAVQTLQDAATTRLVLVTRAQRSALDEAARTAAELDAIGVHPSSLVVNALMPDLDDDPLANAIRRSEQAALATLPEPLRRLTRDDLELQPVNVIGVATLRHLLDDAPPARDFPPSEDQAEPALTADERGLDRLVDALEADGHGVVLCMGKGGVGKTTVAAALAVALAHRGRQVHLATTDPAAHLRQTLPIEIDRITVSQIDPARATADYRDHVMATRGKNLDDEGRATLAEDLRSPCTEEIAVFQQFSRLVLGARDQFVVIDTAPTGHTLLLLDAAGSYHRDVVRQMGGAHVNFRTPMMVLQDPAQSKVLIVTLAEPTPVQEAESLQSDLQRAGITPWAWVINNSLTAAGPTGELLQQRAAAEAPSIQRVRSLSARVVVLPALAREPVGAAGLCGLLASLDVGA